MRTNKFIPILLALAIHLVPMGYFLLKGQDPHQKAGHTSNSPNTSEGIDLNGFSVSRKNRLQNKQQNRQYKIGPTVNSIKSVGFVPEEMGGAHGDEKGVNTGGGSKINGEIDFLKFREPTYPPIAREKGLEGIIKIKASYNQDGNIDKVEIIQSSGHKMLDESVKKSAIEWKVSGGHAGYFEKSFEFRLKN